MFKYLALLATTLALPAIAQQSPAQKALAQTGSVLNMDETVSGQKGGVAQLMLAQEVFAQGVRLGDTTLVIAAAKLAQGVAVTDITRERATGVAIVPDGDGPVEAATMLALAKQRAGQDEIYLSLIDEIEAPEAKGRFGGASRERAALAVGAQESWRVPFFGESYAEVGMTATAGLNVVITDQAGNRVWCPSGPMPVFHCGFAPRENGYFLISLSNPGTTTVRYDLLTN